jgi:filamentous hemagglutinin
VVTKKKNRNKSGMEKAFEPKLRNHALVSALIAAGVISYMPSFAASLPTICAGACGPAANLPFQTGLPAGALPTVSTSTSGTAMTINQTSPTAILNWQNFNIDKGYSVNFVQPSSTASALNRIWDGNPSTIAGSLTANGQIYLINRNGIIFGNGAQVNTQGLIASSLDISDSLYQAGYLTNNTNNANGQPILPTFQGTGGFVRVDTGAVLNGSKIMMFAPVVENNGSISTSGGQAVLAAGNKVYLEASQDPNLRGVLVEVDVSNPGAADPKLAGLVQNDASGTVTNNTPGSILAQRGNITLVGYAVNQQGLLSATTSVTENGSIKLLARHEVNTTANATTQNQYQNVAGNTGYFDIRATQTGTVTLGKDSVTQVLPETSDNSTTTDSQGFRSSIVEAMGNTVDVQGRIIAPGGQVNLVAVGSIDTHAGLIGQSGNNIYQEISPDLAYSSFVNPRYIPGFVSSNLPLVTDGARVFLGSSSMIDVSGSTASVSVARNILDVQLRGSQLADAPLQKDGFLWGKDVNIDIREGSTLANISGDEAQIGRTVAERTSSGGTVFIASTGDAVLNPGSTINLSGGQVDYSGDYVNTSTLISNGVAYDISNAPSSLVYSAIATGGSYSVNHAKWGVTQTWSILAGGDARGAHGIWDPGYIEGKSAGKLAILAPDAVVNSNIISRTVAGIYQRNPYADPAGLAYKDTWRTLARGGDLVIGAASPVVNTTNSQNNFVTNNDVLVQTNPPKTSYALGDALSPNSPITLDAGLFSSGLNNLAVYTNGIAAIDAGTSLALAPGGSVVLKGGQVDMLGSITAPGGSVDFGTVQTVNPLYNFSDPAYKQAGAINVAGNISTRGTWVNDSSVLGPLDPTKPILSGGGNISIKSSADLNVVPGVILDASGGGWVDQSGNIHGGNGGNISLASGAPGDTAGTNYQSVLGRVILNSYGVATGKGGSLSITAADVQIGGTASGGTLLLSPGFFRSGGFSSYNITAQGLIGLSVADNTLVAPESRSLILDRDAVLKSSGTDVHAFSNPGFLPDWQRNPASITLRQAYATPGALTVGTNAGIRVDPKASITLNAANQLTVLGTLDAPAGTINLNLKSGNTAYFPNQSIWLGSGSKLLAQGYFLQSRPNAKNLVQGQVLAGGAINISDNRGFVVTQKASVLDVSGATANIDLPQVNSGTQVFRTSRVAGDAGSISVTTVDGAIFDGSMRGAVENGSQAAAASFSLNLNGVTNYDPAAATNFPPNVSWQLSLKDSGAGDFAAIAGLTPGDNAGAGSASLASIEGHAFLDQNSLRGFDQVTLRSFNSINLADGTSLATRRSITLDSPVISIAGNARLVSAHVTLGNLDSSNQTSVAPKAGTGSLNVSAQLVDLSGKFAVSDANDVTITSSGDIRLNGVLDKSSTSLDAQSLQGEMRTRGDVTLRAGQVYTSTLAQFDVAVEGNPAGTITIQPNNAASPASGSAPVLSAGGSLTLNAANIVQKGVLKAPLGSIDLVGSSGVDLEPGSITSVSAEGQVIPFGLIQGGDAWYYDLTGAGLLASIAAPPQKRVNLEGPAITVASGATVDISGGGDLYANEFFAGTGGTTNVLDPAQAPANTFAILPGISGYSPYDPQAAGQYAQSGSNTILRDGSMVYLSGGNGLEAGYYALLPASYALLPGAYRVTAVPGYQDMLTDGTQIIAGKFAVAGANIQDARWSGFALSSGTIVRTQSEFHDSFANAFFAAQAATNGVITPRSPVDAGQLVVSATGSGATLQLDGIFDSQPAAGGRGAWVDLNGPGFDIVNTAGTGTAGLVELTTHTLNDLGAESLLIGGVRSQDAKGTTISVGADQVQVDNSGATLSGPEIILAAKDAVAVNAGSSISGSGASSGQAQDITIGDASTSGDGALLRVSSGSQVTVARNNVTGNLGMLAVGDGAAVTSQGSVLLDATRSTIVSSTAILAGKELSVAASNIDIGNGSSGNSSLALTPALLAQIQDFRGMTLHSYNDINFYGDSALGGFDTNGGYLISNLVLNAKSLNGIGNAGNTGSIDAAIVTLMNNNGGVTSSAPGGSGSLEVSADRIFLADGSKNIRGFDAVTLDAGGQISGQGAGGLTLASVDANAHSLVLSGIINGSAKSDQSIDASGYDVAIQPGASTSIASNDLGARVVISGKNIMDQGTIDLPAGSVTLRATDSLTLADGSQTIAAGSAKTIAGQNAYAQAGSVSLISDNGNVDIASGAVVDVSGVPGGGDAGSVTVSAVKGAASVAGNFKGVAASGNVQGSFVLDVGSLSGTGNPLTTLNDLLTAGGFAESRDMRVRSGDLVVEGNTVNAHTFHLAADNGSIDVAGSIDASGTAGGDILLAASNDVTLESSALLDAHATDSGNAGGKVALETTGGSINLVNGSSIDVSRATPGSVLLRAPQVNGGMDVAVNTVAGTGINVNTGANVTVEGYKNYAASAISGADAATSSIYFTDAQAFADNAAAIKSRLGMSDANMHVLPGIQISSTGDLTLDTSWDLSTWRFNGEPGILTLKAAGNLNFWTGTSATTANALSDGFTSATGSALLSTPSPSWSYRLVAGADVAAANIMAVNDSGTGNLVIAAGSDKASGAVTNQKLLITPKMIRTGTGSIDIAAGGGLYLGNRDSVIYTAGQLASGIPASIGASTTKAFTAGGGDINIAVKGDISSVGLTGTGAAVNQIITDWLWRQGSADGTLATPPAWWINFGSFAQNIGVLGGGNLDISAGGNITSLSASVPATGYVNVIQDGKGNNVADPADPVTILGGGNLSVKAGGNIDSGMFYVGSGQGTISADGALGVSRSDNTGNLYTILALGQGHYDVRSGGDLGLQTILNPTVIPQSTWQNPNINAINYFFSYGDTSGVTLESLNGNVLLSNDMAAFSSGTALAYNNAAASAVPHYTVKNIHSNGDIPAMMVYPVNLQATSLNGGIAINDSTSNVFSLFPAANGSLQLVAGSDINFLGKLIMSDASPYPFQPNSPFAQYSNIQNSFATGHGTATPSSLLPLHSGDSAPVVIAAGGSIHGDNSSPVYPDLALPKSAQIRAEQDIVNLSASVQNMSSDSVTGYTAGRDIAFTPNADVPSAATVGITVSGPGQLVMQAGHNVDLGQSDGLLTNGNLANPLLPEQGAGITVLAGVAGNMAGAHAFIGKYIDPSSSFARPYGSELISFVNGYVPSPVATVADAYTAFNNLPEDFQNKFVNQVFFDELRASGRSAISSGDYGAGYDAIASLFPASSYLGDVNLYYSQIKTERGGSINILTPGGGVNAGLANPSSSGPQKSAAQLGVVTVKGGDVNAFVNNDFLVNQSRVFTLQGGNILMWSSHGNLDAGKGSKTISSTPPPLLVVDPKTGTFVVDVTQSVVGSGIRVLLANKDVVPGTVDLFAPAGVINAGDAGIGSAGNIFLGAQQVIGASNINFGGTGVGVPVTTVAPVSIGGIANIQDASKVAEQATQSVSSASGSLASFQPSFLSVEVIGLGDEGMSLQP